MIIAIVLLTLAQAPATAAPPQPSPAASPAPHRARRLFISPMGEPIRARTRDEDTLATWFAQADANHDGRLTIEEMQADATRFFGLLDTNKDGEIDPDEITRYENEVAPEIGSGDRFSLESGGDEARRFRRRPGLRGGDDPHQGAGRYGLLDLPEPVVAADADFNRGVSLAEFHRAALQRFLALDLDHHGYLTLAELERIRPAPPPAPNAPEKSHEADESALPQI